MLLFSSFTAGILDDFTITKNWLQIHRKLAATVSENLSSLKIYCEHAWEHVEETSAAHVTTCTGKTLWRPLETRCG